MNARPLATPTGPTAATGQIGDDDIYAFGPPPVSATPAPQKAKKRRWWLWLLLGVFVWVLLLAAAGVFAIASLAGEASEAVQVVINDTPWGGWHPAWLHDLFGAGVGFGTWLLVMAVFCVVALCVAAPLAAVLVFAVGGVLVAATVAAATAVGAAALVVALVTSPIWLAVLLLWRLSRKGQNAGPQGPTPTMNAPT
jgi:hypothetical protein